MKRRREARTDTVPAVHLDLDDIEEILQILSGAETTTISDERHEYADLSDFLDHSEKRPRHLEMTTDHPFLSLRITKAKSVITTPGETDDALHMYADVLALLRTRPRQPAWLFGLAALWILTLLFLGAFLLLIPPDAWDRPLNEPLRPDEPLSARGVAILVGSAVIIAYAFVAGTWRQGGFSLVELKRRRERDFFWTRNKDKILFGIVASVLGAVVTWLLTKVGIALP